MFKKLELGLWLSADLNNKDTALWAIVVVVGVVVVVVVVVVVAEVVEAVIVAGEIFCSFLFY